MKEIWKNIKGYEGKYQVSNCGRVKSLNYRHTGEEKIINTIIDTKGYMKVNLYQNGKGKTYQVHRLVAIAFLDNPNNYPCINHKDENKTNNHTSNLEWCTHKYNANYGTKKERLSKSRRKIKARRSRKVKCITTGEIFDYIKEAGEKYKINGSYITRCCQEKQKSAGKHPITSEKLVWKYWEEA